MKRQIITVIIAIALSLFPIYHYVDAGKIEGSPPNENQSIIIRNHDLYNTSLRDYQTMLKRYLHPFTGDRPWYENCEQQPKEYNQQPYLSEWPTHCEQSPKGCDQPPAEGNNPECLAPDQGQEPRQEPDSNQGQEPRQEPDSNQGQEPRQEPDSNQGQESGQEPDSNNDQESGQEPDSNNDQEPRQEPDSNNDQESPPANNGQNPPTPTGDDSKADPMPKGDIGSTWKQVLAEDFEGQNVPKGKFSNCSNSMPHNCAGLPAEQQKVWGAYPGNWPDTAQLCKDGSGRCPDPRMKSLTFGGIYDPANTISIGPLANGDGAMKVHMFNQGGKNHVAALVPKAMAGKTYGRYAIRFKVSKKEPGYKMAWLLWPENEGKCRGCEIDFPELEFDKTISAFLHPKGNQPQVAFNSGEPFDKWHTAITEWAPGRVTFYLDGKRLGASDKGVPDEPMAWIIQSESALEGKSAAPGSNVDIHITWVAGWTYNGSNR